MIRFIKLKKEHLKTVMDWRMKSEVSEYMITDIEDNLETQYLWYEKVTSDDTYRYWIILCHNIPIGLINLAQIDRVHLRCTAGYYLGETKYRPLGAMIPLYLYNYVFKEMMFRKIYGEVLAGNRNVHKMHDMAGYRTVGIYRDHIFKKGLYYDVILIELLSEDWLKQKRYQRYIAEWES